MKGGIEEMDIMKMGKNPNYLGSWDLEDTPNKELTLTIQSITEELVIGTEGRKESEAVCRFKEPYKPMILNLTNKKTLIKLYGTSDSAKLVGKRITIITKPVKAFGGIFDALRIKPVLPPVKTAPLEKCEVCGGDISPTKTMSSAQVADYSRAKFGKAMCAKCAKQFAAELAAKKEAEQNAEAQTIQDKAINNAVETAPAQAE
jgi:hypothetical protein